jgi:hypothetical protein
LGFLDDARIRELQNAIRGMMQLNRDIWDFMGVLQTYLATRPPTRDHAGPEFVTPPLVRAARER